MRGPLEEAAARVDAAEKERDRNRRERVLAGEESDEDARIAVAGDERRVGGVMDRADFDGAREAGRGSSNETEGNRQSGDPDAGERRGADVAADHPRGETVHAAHEEQVGD